MPPCSAQSILKEDPSMPSLLLTNYDKEFENKMFHSIYDSAAFHKYNNTLGSSQPVVRHYEISNTFWYFTKNTFLEI